MIKYNEVRFGNLVNQDGQITSINAGHFLSVDLGAKELKGIDPIPLSPEWLERCGFERVKEEDSNHYLSYSILKLDGVITKQEDGWYQMITDVDGYYEQNVGVKLEYVHQLQNRYQSFTGEELQIKMP